MDFTPRPGGCACGAVRYELVADPITLYACHCTDCQTATGSSYALSMLVPHDALRLVRGETELRSFHLSDGRERRGRFCPACDTVLWAEPSRFPELRNLQPGTLDDTSWLEPVGHIWTGSAQPWVTLPPKALQYPAQPGDAAWLDMVRAWKARG